MKASVAILILLIFAFCLTIKAGERGFFAFDQSIVFDGGYRILSGQVPYKDFLAPYGVVLFYIQAIVFKNIGVNYFSYIFTAAMMNILFTLFVILVIRFLFSGQRILAYLAGFLSAIWFYPPFGTPWAEQAAFLFSLGGITIILYSFFVNSSLPLKSFSMLLAGGLFTLSFLTKQNASLLLAPVYFLLIIIWYFPNFRSILYNTGLFLAGISASMLLFFLWLIFKSDLKNFFQYSLYLPFFLGVYRIFLQKLSLANILLGANCCSLSLHRLPLGIRFIFSISLLSSFLFCFLYFYKYKQFKDAWKKQFIASVLCISTIYAQYFFIHSSMNEAENGIPFMGINFAICAGLLSNLFSKKIIVYPRAKFMVNSILICIAILSSIYLSLLGISVSLSRKVQGLNKSRFVKYLTIEKLKNLKWAEPTQVHNIDIKADDVIKLYEYLKGRKMNFFILPDFTIFYGLMGVPSPQPLLWFHKGLTYPVLYDANLDKRIVEDLKKNRVKLIILEETRQFAVRQILKDFPGLNTYINENFSYAAKMGIFSIYEGI